MALGPGKYDDTCDEVRLKHNARMTILVIIDGDRGNGVSTKTVLTTKELLTLPDIDRQVAKILRHVADEIDHNIPNN